MQLTCGVVAPSCIPRKASARVQTDRRGAPQLARLLGSGDLTPGYVPAVEDEAIRDLVRARRSAQRWESCQGATQSVLVTSGYWSEGRTTWGPAPLRWLAKVMCPTPAQQIVFQVYVRAVSEHPERLQRLEAGLQALVKTWRCSPVIEAIQALR